MSDLQMMTGVTSMLCAVLFAIPVLSDKVKDGVVIKAGLIAVVGSFFVTAMLTFEQSRNWEAYAVANLINRLGLMIAIGGFMWRAWQPRPKKKSEAHSQRTNQLLSGMSSPASDLMDLLIDTKEKEKQ